MNVLFGSFVTMTTLITAYVLSALLIVIGLLGTVLPVLPGIPVMFAGMWLAAWMGDYAYVSAGTVIGLALATALSIAIDLLASLVGAQRVGASRKALLGAGVGGVVGLFFGMPGLLAGPYLGAMSGELAHGSHWRAAAKIGAGTWLGIVLGSILKLGLAVAMLVTFLLALWLP